MKTPAAPEIPVKTPEILGKTPLGDMLLMGLGVAFVACLVAHHVFGVGKDPVKEVSSE